MESTVEQVIVRGISTVYEQLSQQLEMVKDTLKNVKRTTQSRQGQLVQKNQLARSLLDFSFTIQ